MAVTSQIALRIAGTKQRQAGFAPLVTVGVLAGGEGNNMDQVPLVNDKPGYIIKHTEEYILYLLIDRRVKSFDADAPGCSVSHCPSHEKYSWQKAEVPILF